MLFFRNLLFGIPKQMECSDIVHLKIDLKPWTFFKKLCTEKFFFMNRTHFTQRTLCEAKKIHKKNFFPKKKFHLLPEMNSAC